MTAHEEAAGATYVSTSVYVSFDIHHDRELYERLLVQSGMAGFTVSSGSETSFVPEFGWDSRLRRRIRDADQMIVICGEHSDASQCMTGEIRIAQEEATPYFLLWGRRELMCTKPVGAKNTEGMYSWTPANLQDQLAIGLRSARALPIEGARRRSESEDLSVETESIALKPPPGGPCA